MADRLHLLKTRFIKMWGAQKKTKQYIYCVIAVVVVSLLCFALTDWMGYRVVAFVLLLAVSLLAITFDILPVLLAAALSAFIWDFFFIPPRYNVHVETTEDTILLIMYFVIAMINGVLTARIRKAENASRLKEERANSVTLYNAILNSLSHELRTPLAAIIGATDNLQSNDNLTTENRNDLVREISKASLRLNQQVENLLNISRLESGHIKPKNDWCDVVELIYQVVKRVEENNPHRRINISVNENLPLCLLDKGMLDQVLYNLLNNAALHTESSAQISIAATCHGNLLQVIVEDSGKGFSASELMNVFNKFSRTPQSKNAGAGLGLSIVKGFTEALDGDVIIENGREGGAKFTVTIPVKTNAVPITNE
jgi:two-component system, OmpR family, sensor histidine kinase KdpD